MSKTGPRLPGGAKYIRPRGVTLLVLGLALVTGHGWSNSRAQSAPAAATEPNGAAHFYLLASNPTDRPLFNGASTEALKHLAGAKGLKAIHRAAALEISGPTNENNLSFAITAGGTPWDLSGYLYLVADVRNAGARDVTIVCRAEDPEYAGWHHFAESVARLPAGRTTSVLVFLKRKNAPDAAERDRFPGMHALPDGYMPMWSGLDPARISKVVFALEAPGPGLKLDLLGLRANGVCDPRPLSAPGFFPFIDRFGQFQHAEWPGKIHSSPELVTQRQAEAAALRAEPRPASWDQYGGYQDGPQLPASGHFRVEKYEGKWWFVDPAGHLFWSQGVTGVGFSAATRVQGRRQFFAELPPAERDDAGSVNFYRANLRLKYGDGFEAIIPPLTHTRLQSWGLNTLASWSDPAVCALDKTPYTKTLNIGAPKLAPGLKLPDPFDPAFALNARRAFEAERDSTGKDPWCIGYFIANELEWRGGPDLVNEVLTAPADRAGKQALVKMLQQRHPTIADLNAAWHTRYDSWSALLHATARVDAAAALADFTAFNEALAERYYQTCATALKQATPDKLNLGTRFHTFNPIAVRAAARYCDVVSFNKYATSIRNLALPDGLDRPIIVGEFHFPAWDRSFTADADRSPLSQTQRADAYWYYVTGALENPQVVGTHWFQYLDQPLTGRSDGENAPIGFVDVTDTPYRELTRVTRELGASLYARRLGHNLPATAKAGTAPKVEASEKIPPQMVHPATALPARLHREVDIYKRVGTNELKLFVIKPPGWQSQDRHPAIVLFHGGGWVWGTPDLLGPEANYFARRGMVSVLVQYRLLAKDAQAPPTVCVQDAKSAMRWVRAHAAELGVNPQRIAAGGGSAGGHLAAFVGLVSGLDDPGDNLAVSPKADALVLWNPVFNNGPGQWGHELVGDRYREFSPAHHITRNAPPAIVFLGTQDQYVPVKTVLDFQAGMKAAGVRCDALFYEGQAHGFFSQQPWLSKTLAAADQFLVSLGWLGGEPAMSVAGSKSGQPSPSADTPQPPDQPRDLAQKSL